MSPELFPLIRLSTMLKKNEFGPQVEKTGGLTSEQRRQLKCESQFQTGSNPGLFYGTSFFVCLTVCLYPPVVSIEITQYQVVLELLQSNNTCNQYFLYTHPERNDYFYGFVRSQSPRFKLMRCVITTLH